MTASAPARTIGATDHRFGFMTTSQTPPPSPVRPLDLARLRSPIAIAGVGGALALVCFLVATVQGGDDARGWLSAALVAGLLGAAALLRRGFVEQRAARRVGATGASALREAATATIVVARNGRLRFASATAADLLRYDRDALLAVGLGDLLSPLEATTVLELARGAAGTRTSLDGRFRMGNGDWLPVEMAVTNLVADPHVGGLVVSIHDVTRWKVLEEALTDLAFHDSLTRLPNRALFIDRLEHALGRRRRHARGTAVLFVDLDDFKTVNDSLGHVEADAVLAMVAERLLASIRPEDTAGRLGGDEFAILLDDVDEEHAATVAARVLEALEAPFVLPQRPIRIGGSIGIAHSAAGLTRSTDLLRAADIAMYHAKESGKNQYR